jgi:legumain
MTLPKLSGPGDNVFVFFSDHGAPGLVAFPDGSVLHAKDLNKTIAYMHEQGKYQNVKSCIKKVKVK